MENWRDIDITTADGRQSLRLFVAQRVGWTNIELRGVWSGLEFTGFEPDDCCSDMLGVVPQYAESLDAAIALQHDGAHLDLIIRSGEDGAAIAAFIEDGGYRRISTKSTNPAVAVCLAWLAYFELEIEEKESSVSE